MAATTAGALKALIESFGLGLTAHRDTVPENLPGRYVRITEAVAVSINADGDFGDSTATRTAREEVQLDLFQSHRDAAGTVVESYTIPDELARRLHGARLTAASKRVYGLRVLTWNRFPDENPNIVRHTYTVEVQRVV